MKHVNVVLNRVSDKIMEQFDKWLNELDEAVKQVGILTDYGPDYQELMKLNDPFEIEDMLIRFGYMDCKE